MSIWEGRAPSWLKSEGSLLSKCCFTVSFFSVCCNQTWFDPRFTLGRAVCTGPAVCGERPTPLDSLGSVNRYFVFCSYPFMLSCFNVCSFQIFCLREVASLNTVSSRSLLFLLFGHQYSSFLLKRSLQTQCSAGPFVAQLDTTSVCPCAPKATQKDFVSCHSSKL